MNYYFITEKLKDEITTVISNVFPNLNINHKYLLLDLLLDLLDTIAIKFNFDLSKRTIYENQFRQNNYQDLRGFLLMLLPYINDDGDKKKQLKNLNELFIKKKIGSTNSDKISPQYEYTNVQYSRCKRDGNKSIEIPFSIKYLMHNFYLLRDTINHVANKLYVNWLDITPLPRIQLVETDSIELITNTQTIIDNKELKEWDFNDRKQKPTFTLTIADIYDVISNDLYENIKNIKWTIFDVRYGEDVIPLLNILDKLIDLSNILNGVKYHKLEQQLKYKFNQEWQNLINSIESNTTRMKINREIIEKVLKVLIIFFDNNYKNIDEAEKTGYIRLKTPVDTEDDEEDDIDEDKKINTISKDVILRSAKSVNPEHIYNFIENDLTILKKSYYGKLLLISEQGKYTLTNTFKLYNSLDIQYKNLYNFAKSLVHNFRIKTKFRYQKRYSIFWKMLSYDDREVILNRLNLDLESKDDIVYWFNIGRYLKTYFGLEGDDAVNRNAEIFKIIMNNLAFIIYDVLATKGVLSKFEPNNKLTDNAKLPTIEKVKKEYMRNQLKNSLKNSRLDDCYYFLTGQKYTDVIIKSTNNTYNYPTYIAEKMADGWTTTYAMNWVSQIAFYHHYMNNRIIFITGSTGVGKSTQTPKLFLYALKMIDYKDNGKIICSQPRIRPTEQNAQTIATEMGVSLTEYSSNRKTEVESSNYYIQFKHNENSHISEKSGLILRVVTDGTLLQEISKNPLLKRKTRDNRYTKNNIYDTVIVDETHEHNPNMDFILTLLKYTTYYNNNIRLVLISATMDDDEPIYRRFYREINDNRLYPINYALAKYNLDRINVDRRIHISPPGASTRSKIIDIYTPDQNPDELVLKIARETKIGDILLFQPGQSEINQSVEYLNKNLPSDIIALPYFSQMPQAQKELVENIHKNDNIYNLTTPKSVSFVTDTGETQVAKGTYKRVVIVATNIAEASITITTLRYVVDTGLQKSNEYNYQIRDAVLVTSTISETSRIQRRGRVGRIPGVPGTVYYMYKENAMKNNRIQYKISTSDISENLFTLLRISSEENELIPTIINPNKSSLLYDTVTIAKYGVDKMLLEQYFTRDQFISYYGDHTQYDYQNDRPPHSYYETGYSYETLIDNTGTFYIIHPDELCLFRNMIGNIVDIIKSDLCNVILNNCKIFSKKMDSFMNILYDRLMIFSTESGIYKTTYGTNILKLKQELELEDIKDLSNVISYIYSRQYGVSEDLVKLIPMFTVLSGAVRTLIRGETINDKYIVKIQEIQKMYNEINSDSCVLIKIIDTILEYIRKLGVYSLNEKSDQFLLQEKINYLSGNYSSVNQRLIKIFDKLKSKGDLENTTNLSMAEMNQLQKYHVIIKYNPTILDNNENKFEQWCYDHYLNHKTVRRYIEHYFKFLNKVLSCDKELLQWFDNHLEKTVKIQDAPYSRCFNITASLLHGYNFNIAKRIGTTGFYTLISYPDPKYTYNIKEITTNIYDTLVTTFGDYILFINKSDFGLSLIHNVTPKMIQQVASYIYTKERFNEDQYNDTKNRELIKYLISLFDSNKDKAKKYIASNIEQQYTKTIVDMKLDMINNYDSKILHYYSKLDDNKLFKKSMNDNKRKYKNIQYGGQVITYTNINIPYIRYLHDILT